MEATSTAISIKAAVLNGAYVSAFLAGMEFLGLMPLSVAILMLFIFFDIVAGILKSYALYGGSSIKSSVFERGIIAKALVICIPLNIALAGKGVGLDLVPIAQGTITVLILSELYSLLGNWYAIRTGKERIEFDAVAYVVGQLKGFLKKLIVDDAV